MRKRGVDSATSWGVAVACCLVGLIQMIPLRMSALLYVEILQNFDTERTLAALPVFLATFVRCCGGPLIGFCGEKFQAERLITFGCVLSSLSVAACFFAKDVIVLIIFFGLLHGFGNAFACLLVPQILKPHFAKHLDKSIGLSLAGGPLGTLCVTPLVESLFHKYQFAGTMLILSGILLHSVPIALFIEGTAPSKSLPKLRKGSECMLKRTEKSGETACSADADGKSITVKNNQQILSETKKLKITPLEPDSRLYNATSSLSLEGGCNEVNFETGEGENDDLLDQSRDLSLPRTTLITSNSSLLLNTGEPQTSRDKISKAILLPGNSRSFTKSKANCGSLRVFLNPVFLTLMVFQSFYSYVVVVIWTTAIDFSRDKGIDSSKEIYLLMCIPLADSFGRLGLGFISDKQYVTKTTFCIISYVIMALTCTSIAWASEFYVMALSLLVFGITASGMGNIHPAIVFEYINRSEQVMAISSRFMLFGPMILSALPMIGYFRSTLGSYAWIYYILSVCCLISAMLAGSLPFMAKRRNTKDDKNQAEIKCSFK